MFEPGCIITSSHTKMGAGYIPPKTFDAHGPADGSTVHECSYFVKRHAAVCVGPFLNSQPASLVHSFA